MRHENPPPNFTFLSLSLPVPFFSARRFGQSGDPSSTALAIKTGFRLSFTVDFIRTAKQLGFVSMWVSFSTSMSPLCCYISLLLYAQKLSLHLYNFVCCICESSRIAELVHQQLIYHSVCKLPIELDCFCLCIAILNFSV